MISDTTVKASLSIMSAPSTTLSISGAGGWRCPYEVSIGACWRRRVGLLLDFVSDIVVAKVENNSELSDRVFLPFPYLCSLSKQCI